MTRSATPDASRLARGVLAAIQNACRRPAVYRVLQYVAEPTTSRFRALLRHHVHAGPHERLLDLACGIGNYRGDVGGDYYGADINPDYIATARERHSGTFEVMDGRALTYPDQFFDHVVDAILPETGNRAFKGLWFGLDAGRFPRTRDQLRGLLAAHGAITVEELLPGPLHDCAYFGVRAR